LSDSLLRPSDQYPGDYRKRPRGSILGPLQRRLLDPITEHIYATTSPYRERKIERDTFNSDDFIFVRQGGADTIVDLKKKGGSYLASMVIGIERSR
jgi:hypothetical protein